MTPATKGQVEVTINWVYILIVGAVILLFFFSLVQVQKNSSEENLQRDLNRIMESIFTVAGLSEKTKTSIDTHLADYQLSFDCQEGVSHYGLMGSASPIEDAIFPLFSPTTMKAAKLSLWSLPYKLPYKVMDFLFVTSPTTQYVLVGDSGFTREFIAQTRTDPALQFSINAVQLSTEQLSTFDPDKNEIRLIDVSNMPHDHDLVPLSLRPLADEKVTAVVFIGNNLVQYLQKEDDHWLAAGTVSLVSLGEERDATKYAAIFSASPELYDCNIHKVWQRLGYLNEIYGGPEIAIGHAGGKLAELQQYYQDRPYLSLSSACTIYLTTLQEALQAQQNAVQACLLDSQSCPDLISSATRIKTTNQQLIEEDCLSLY